MGTIPLSYCNGCSNGAHHFDHALAKEDTIAGAGDGRQWPEVYDLCHTFLQVEQVKIHIVMQESNVLCAILAWQCFFLLKQHAKTY